MIILIKGEDQTLHSRILKFLFPRGKCLLTFYNCLQLILKVNKCREKEYIANFKKSLIKNARREGLDEEAVLTKFASR